VASLPACAARHNATAELPIKMASSQAARHFAFRRELFDQPVDGAR